MGKSCRGHRALSVILRLSNSEAPGGEIKSASPKPGDDAEGFPLSVSILSNKKYPISSAKASEMLSRAFASPPWLAGQ